MRPVFRLNLFLSRPWFFLLQSLFRRLLLMFFPLSIHLPMFPKAKEIMSDDVTIRSLFLSAVSIRTKVILLKLVHSLSYSSEHCCFDIGLIRFIFHLPSSNASNTTLSTISDTSPTWLLDFACCNHMTSSPDVVPSHTSTSLPTIYTANGSPMQVSHLGNVSTPALSISNVY